MLDNYTITVVLILLNSLFFLFFFFLSFTFPTSKYLSSTTKIREREIITKMYNPVKLYSGAKQDIMCFFR